LARQDLSISQSSCLRGDGKKSIRALLGNGRQETISQLTKAVGSNERSNPACSFYAGQRLAHKIGRKKIIKHETALLC